MRRSEHQQGGEKFKLKMHPTHNSHPHELREHEEDFEDGDEDDEDDADVIIHGLGA